MKLPVFLAIGLVIVIGLGVYFLKNPALLYYPAAWAAVGGAFWGLNKALGNAAQPSQQSGDQQGGNQSPESSSDSDAPAMAS